MSEDGEPSPVFIGIKCNMGNISIDLSLGLDDIGISGSFSKNNSTYSLELKIDISEIKVGLESSVATQCGNITDIAYTNVSYSGWAIVALFCMIATGQPALSPSYSY